MITGRNLQENCGSWQGSKNGDDIFSCSESLKRKVDSIPVSGYNNSEVVYISGMDFQFAGCMVRRSCPWIRK